MANRPLPSVEENERSHLFSGFGMGSLKNGKRYHLHVVEYKGFATSSNQNRSRIVKDCDNTKNEEEYIAVRSMLVFEKPLVAHDGLVLEPAVNPLRVKFGFVIAPIPGRGFAKARRNLITPKIRLATTLYCLFPHFMLLFLLV